jgi:hypothetical protein
VQDARGVQAVLHTAADDREVGVGHVQVRIDPECDGEELGPVRRIAVEEVAIVEIPVGARIGDRLRRLVDRKIVGLGQHV